MGFLDRLKGQASGLKDITVDTAAKNKDKIAGGLDKAGDFVDKQTKGKYTDKIATSKVKAREGLEKLDNAATGRPAETTPPAGHSSNGTPTAPPVSDTFGTTPPRPPSDDPDATPPPVS